MDHPISPTRRPRSVLAALGGAAVLASGLAVALPGTASAALAAPTITSTVSGNTISVTVTNPNAAGADAATPSCAPIAYRWQNLVHGDQEPFAWQPTPPEMPEEGWPSEAAALAAAQAAGYATPGTSATSSFTVPGNGVYAVVAACDGEAEPVASGVRAHVIGTTPSGPAITASANGRTLTTTVSNTDYDACGVAVGEVSQPWAPDAHRAQTPDENVATEGTTGTDTFTVPRDGWYAIVGICADEGGEPVVTDPPKLVEVGGTTTTPPTGGNPFQDFFNGILEAIGS